MIYDADGNLYMKNTNKYDKRGNNIETIMQNTDDSMNYKFIMKYDNNNKKIEDSNYQLDGKFRFKNTYLYPVSSLWTI